MKYLYFRFSNDQHGTYKCALLENPKNKIIILENKTLTLEDTVGQGRGSEFVQISPQRIRLKLRLGEKTKVSFKVANAKKYPVDLYYLMDLSNSMSDDRDTVVSTVTHSSFIHQFENAYNFICHYKLCQ